MDLFSDLLGVLGTFARYDSKTREKMADAGWSPLGLLLLFVFAGLAVVYCVTAPHR
jgi:hypothetical protein